MNSEERWLPVPGWEGDLEVSDLGNIRRLPRSERSKVVYLRPRRCRSKYKFLCVRPWRNGKQYYMSVAQAVLAAFRPSDPSEFWIKHRNHDISDCRLSNLRWIRGRDRGIMPENTEELSRIDSWEVLDLYKKGYAIPGIAHELHLDERTVERKLLRAVAKITTLPRLDSDTRRAVTESNSFAIGAHND